MAKTSAVKEEPLPDHLRCGRTDGRKWRCKRQVMDNLKLCEIHYLQGKHRQYREKVPESLKLQRKRKNEEETAVIDNEEEEEPTRAQSDCRMELRKRKKKKKQKLAEGSESLVGSGSGSGKKKQCDKQLELIRMVLEREVEKRKKNGNNKNKKKKKKIINKKKKIKEEKEKGELRQNSEELRRELPNGVMEISPASTSQHDHNNVDVKVDGIDYNKAICARPRQFRSKNVNRVPVGKLQVMPNGSSMKKGSTKKNKCHWCQRTDSPNLIKCSTCQKEFFCLDCITERYCDTQNEVKKACPVCRGTCTCKGCSASQCKDIESKAYLAGKSKVDKILHFHYLICMLLPALKQISEDWETELQTEAKLKGKDISDIQIKQVEFGCNENNSCNHCKAPVLDLHRSCASCSYRLCLSCCEELSQRRTSGEISSSMLELTEKIEACVDSEGHTSDQKEVSNGNLTATLILPEGKNCNDIENAPCPPTELGGCGKGQLDLRCMFPSSWIKEMEVKAEEIVCSYDVPETLDKSSSCSLCFDTDHNTNRSKQLQKAALREDSSDNCLFCPTVLDISGDNFEHFQKHWGKGHPIVVRDAFQNTSNLSWNPLFMFCTYLEQSITRYENNKDLLESCLDWCEVEINIRQYFTGSLRSRRPQRNTCHEMLKLTGWLSSQIFKEQFPAHFAELIDALPVQEYMNPVSGLLNLSANLPHGSVKHDIGPYVYISYGSADKDAESVTKLCYDSYDVVNIMTHTVDAPLSTEQLTKISKLLKKHKALCQMESVATEQLQKQKAKEMASSHTEEMEQKGSQSMEKKEMDFFRRVDRTSCISTEANNAATQSIDRNISQNAKCDIFSSEPSLHGTVQTTDLSTHDNPKTPFESSNSCEKTEHVGAEWDVFRRQDVPKLIEYLKRHYDELSCTHDYDKKMVHPILDQSIFLDSYHKMRLKEEFKIEPWSFKQHVGEAVIIPAGCPYQIRNPKCCVHAVLEFVSPENVTECIQLIDEVRLLPEDHKAKVDKLEVKKLALHSMSSAIKDIGQLTCKT